VKPERMPAFVEIIERVPDVLLPYIDHWTVQEPGLLDLQIVELMQGQIDAGEAWLLKHGDTYVFLRRQTPWIGDTHIFNLGSTWNMVRAVRAITARCLQAFVKLETRHHDKRIGSMIRRCGWRPEAVYRSAFCTRDGRFVDEYGYGIVRGDAWAG
jgi:hypothetical protein